MRVSRRIAAPPLRRAVSYKIPRFVSAFFLQEPGVRRRVAQHMSPSRPHPGTSLLTRPSLLFRVREWNDSASWEEFHRLYRRLIYGRARRAGLAHADAEDVAQDVFKRVAETIHDFDINPERGSFRGWLMK